MTGGGRVGAVLIGGGGGLVVTVPVECERIDVEVVPGGHPSLHEVTVIVEVVEEIEMKVVEL